VAEVSTKEIRTYGNGDKTVIMFDCGMKYNQIRCLLKRGLRVKVVPFNYDLSKEKEPYHAVFVSNGPGDPTFAKETVNQLKELLNVLNLFFSFFFLVLTKCLG